MNLLRVEEVVFLFSLGFLSCVTAQTDAPGAGILPLPGGIEAILSPRTQIPTARFGDPSGFSCTLTMPPLGGPRWAGAGAVVVGSSVFTGGAARGCTTGGRVQENTVSLPLAVGAAELPAGMDTGTRGPGGMGHRVGPLPWQEDAQPQGCRAAPKPLSVWDPPQILLREGCWG